MTKTIHHSITCTLSALAVLLVALVAGSAAAESKTYVQEYAYRAGKVDGKESSQTIKDLSTAIELSPKEVGPYYNRRLAHAELY